MATANRSRSSRSPGAARKAATAPGEARPRKAKRPAPRSEVRPHDGGLRRDLIAAALELVEASGTRGLSWREVARRADVSHSAPYRHFANKEELLAAVAEQGFCSLTARMIEQMEQQGMIGPQIGNRPREVLLPGAEVLADDEY